MTERQRALLTSGWTYAFCWLLTRIWMFGSWPFYATVTGDPAYYYRKLQALSTVGIAQTMTEYPTPVVAGLDAVYAVAPGAPGHTFMLAFAALMALADGLFAALLWWSGGPQARRGAYVWLVFLFLSGPITFFRFDVLPAVFAGAALVLLARHPRVSGALIALGAGMKLWPALLIAPLLAVRRTWIRALLGFLVCGVVLAAGSLVWSGFARSISPLTWQKERGLQIESIVATPVMGLKALGSHRWEIFFSSFNAYEIKGPGTDLLLSASTLLTAVGGLAIVLLCWRLFRTSDRGLEPIAYSLLFIVAVMIITNKTLSPQYLIWLGGPLAAYVALSPADAAPLARRRLRTAVGGAYALAGLTTLVYPVLYSYICGNGSSAAVAVCTGVLVARNLLLVVATGWLFVAAWRSMRPTREEVSA